MQRKTSWIASSFDDVLASQGSITTERHWNAKSTKIRPSGSSHQNSDIEKLWVNKYTPTCVADLAVNKKKVASLREVLERGFSQCRKPGSGAQIILLTGDTGAGKSTTLRLLAKELHAELKEWVFPAADQFVATDLFSSNDVMPYESQWSKFCDFLFRANRYSSVALCPGDIQEQRKVILIEDFPHVFRRNVDSFHSVLRRYRSLGRCPLVFILGSSDGSSLEHLLFTKTLQTELCIELVNFNAVAPTVLSKTLLKIAELEDSGSGHLSIRMPASDVIEQLVAASHGDIRAAINALQFYCQTSGNDSCQANCVLQTTLSTRNYDRKSKVARTGDRKTKKMKLSGESYGNICERDSMLSLFHAVGKVLHCKRDSTMSTDEDLLPDHMSDMRRRLLIVDPEDVADKVHLTCEQFVAFLHQNFLDFHMDINDVLSVELYLSDCEVMTANWATKPLLQSYAISVATRGCLFSMPNGPTAVGWKPLHKPQMADVSRKVDHHTSCTKDLFASCNLPTVILHAELFPYLSLCASRAGLSRSQTGHIDSIARLPLNTVGGSARLERLNERDTAIFDDTIEQSESTSSSSVARDHTTTNGRELQQMDIVDSDVIIEEFDD